MRDPVRWALLVLLMLALPLSAETFSPDAATAEQVRELSAGGFVLFMRHGATDTSQPDQVPVDLDDCATQRPLSDQGREGLRLIATAWQSLQIPVHEVHSSPLCRAVETAHMVFGDQVEVNPDLMYVAALTDAEKAPILVETERLLSLPVAPGQNRVLVAHGPNLAELMEYFPPEGSVVIFRPGGDQGYEYVASITPADWPALLEQLAH